MSEFQRGRVSLFCDTPKIMLSWMDFTGDMVWIYQRFHDHHEGHDSQGHSYGVAATVFLCLAVVITATATVYTTFVLRPDDLTGGKTDNAVFLTIFILSFTNPDLLIFFPFAEEAYLEDSVIAYPSPVWLHLSLTRVVEDIPQFFLQVVFMLTHPFDGFTFFNLLFTSIMVVYLALGKAFKLLIIYQQDKNKVTPSLDKADAGKAPRASQSKADKQDLVRSGEQT